MDASVPKSSQDSPIFHIATPLIRSYPLQQQLGKPVYLKMECYQPTGSFKLRGLGNLCTRAFEDGARHLISSSGGNAGYNVAFLGNKLGIRVTVVVPQTTDMEMREKIEQEGANVTVHGEAWDEADQLARELSKEPDSAYISPFDHPRIWEGHSTLVKEIDDAGVRPGIVVLAVGGGGLLCGVAQGLHSLGWDDVPILAVETTGAASLYRSMEARSLVTLSSIETVATSLGAKSVAKRTYDWTTKHPIYPWLATDAQAVKASLQFADMHRTLVEPACGAALAAIFEKAPPIDNVENVVVVVCGGAGISLQKLQKIALDLQISFP